MNRIFTTIFAFMLGFGMPAFAQTQPNLDQVLQLAEQTEYQLTQWSELANNIMKLGDAPVTMQLSAERDRLMTETAALLDIYETEMEQADIAVLSWLKECQTQDECLMMMDSMEAYLEMRERLTEGPALLEGVLFREQFMIYAETLAD
jgi:hypothetical protein